MTREELGFKVIEAYQKWGEWLAGLDLAAIAAVAFLYGFAKAIPKTGVPIPAKAALGCFGTSVLLSSMLVGNLPHVAARFVSAPDVTVAQIPEQSLLTFVCSPLWVVSALAGLTFTAGAILLAVETAMRRSGV
jgi:hypothetical protein